VEFEWDGVKSDRTFRARQFDFQFASRIFRGTTLEWADTRRPYGEDRVRALGEVNGRLLHVVYTMRGDTCRIISARLANRRERLQWQLRE
jgi:uncharacterized DUF497 family protein